jgi:hypothetical protein
MTEGINTRAEMTAVLRDKYGLSVSEATVGRFMARVRSAAGEEAYHTITKHVNEVLPGDLEALEEIEKTCLEWSREAGIDTKERIAEAVGNIQREIAEFTSILVNSNDPEKVAKQILKKCLGYILADDRRQEQRLSAMRNVQKIIELKLNKAGLLDDDQNGRIILVKNQHQDDSPPDNNGDGGRVLHLIGDNTNG